MAIKNFVFRQNCVGRKVDGMKKTFFANFDPTWTHILAQQTQTRNSLNSILVKKDRYYIIFNFLNLRLTN